MVERRCAVLGGLELGGALQARARGREPKEAVATGGKPKRSRAVDREITGLEREGVIDADHVPRLAELTE